MCKKPRNISKNLTEVFRGALNYKTTNDGITLYLNLACVNGTDLQAKITEAVRKMDNGEAAMAKAVPVPQYNRAGNAKVTGTKIS